jgi:UTP--glucose-1-phosphate uridylyltransferase
MLKELNPIVNPSKGKMSEIKKVNKAVILAAGFGTRFLPASKAVPKIMFPVIDRPIIQYVTEEAVEAGIKEVIFVLSPFTQEIRRHFEPFEELNKVLAEGGKEDYLNELKEIEQMAKFSFCLQKEGKRRGTGVAILSAQELVGDEPFLLLFADEFYKASPGRVTQLLEVYNEYGGTVLGCIRTGNPEDGARFGFAVGEEVKERVIEVSDVIEKPGVGQAPSDLATMSGQIFTPDIFEYLKKADKEIEEQRELYYIDGIKGQLAGGRKVYAVEYQNYRFFDTGDRYGYLKTLVELGIENPKFGEDFKIWLKQKLQD